MIKFAFLLTLYVDDVANVYVMETNLTGSDCIELVENYMQTTPDYTFGIPSCEIDLHGTEGAK